MKLNGGNFTAFTLDTTTGIVTFTGSPIPKGSDVLTWSGEFDVPCRFSSDKLEVTWGTVDYGHTRVMIEEVRV